MSNRFVRYVSRDRIEIVTRFADCDQVKSVKIEPNPDCECLVGISMTFQEALRLGRDCERMDAAGSPR